MFKLQIFRGFQRILLPSTPTFRQWTSISNYSTRKQSNKNALISDLLKQNGQVAEYGEIALKNTFAVLEQVGFGGSHIIEMISTYPPLLRFQPKDLANRLEMWHCYQFSRPHYYNLFIERPELLECDDEQYLKDRNCKLQSFAWTSKNIWRLLVQSPNVLFDDMKSINEKVDYIFEEMQCDMTDLVKSCALALPLEKIKSRHMLLVRLGIYKKVNKKASVLSNDKNPRLIRIMDSSDREFAKKICHVTEGELEVFYEYYQKELEAIEKEKIQYEEDTDEEYDEDSDDEYNFDPRENADEYDDRPKQNKDIPPTNFE